jgi:hypothetical protein
MRLKGKKPEKIQSKEEIWKMDFLKKKIETIWHCH